MASGIGLKKGDKVVVSVWEHHSNLLPWIRVKNVDCDFLAFSGHKMLGPTGTGGLFVKEEPMENIEPLVVGGGAVGDASFEDYSLKIMAMGTAKLLSGERG